MKHRASSEFWSRYERLPDHVQRLADRCYRTLRDDPQHPSLHFRPVGRFYSVRVGIHYRALAVQDGDDFVWLWIGTHAEYDRLVARQ